MATARIYRRRQTLAGLPLTPALQAAVLRSYCATPPEKWPIVQRRLTRELSTGLQVS